MCARAHLCFDYSVGHSLDFVGLESSDHVPSCRIGREMKIEEGMKRKKAKRHIRFHEKGFEKLSQDTAAYITLPGDVTSTPTCMAG